MVQREWSIRMARISLGKARLLAFLLAFLALICVLILTIVYFAPFVGGNNGRAVHVLPCLGDAREGVNDEGAVAEEGDTSVSATPDIRRAEQMRSLLDGGDVGAALRIARSLVSSNERPVKEEVILVLGWCGKRALPELIQLMSDPDADIANQAFSAWENAIMEVASDRVKALRIEEMVSCINDRAKIESALMRFTEFDETLSLMSLERIILNNRGRAASVCAKELFEHIAGEPWASKERTAKIINKN